jgi:hypothetical protein
MPVLQNKSQINRELQRLGLGKLSDPKLFDQMAFLVRDHDHFRGMLMHEEPANRKQMYDCLAPRLRFKAKPLYDYEADSKRIAEEKQLPQYNPKNLELREIRPYHLKSEEFQEAEKLRRETEAFVESMREVPEVIPHASPRSASDIVAAQIESRNALTKRAEEAITRDLREEGAKYQLQLACAICTYQQNIRVKRKPAAYKIAKEYGWTFPEQGKALCFACSKKRVN